MLAVNVQLCVPAHAGFRQVRRAIYMPVPAEVIQVLGKLGIKGVSRVRCKIIDGRDKDKIVTRNTVGPIRIGDIIMLKETAMDTEAKLAQR